MRCTDLGSTTVVGKQASDVDGLKDRRVTGLVDVLCTLAANWVRCECEKKIREAGVNGWEKRGLLLGERIDLLNKQLPVVKSRAKRKVMENEVKQLEAKSDALNQEWRKVYDETRAFENWFEEARDFCKQTCNINDDELFNSALVRFRSKRLQPEQVPSDSRMAKIKSMLKVVPSARWKGHTWANPPKPTWGTAKRASPSVLDSFITQELRGTPPAHCDELTITEVAEAIGENKGTIWRLIKRGVLIDNKKTGRLRRIKLASVLQYCKEKGIVYEPT